MAFNLIGKVTLAASALAFSTALASAAECLPNSPVLGVARVLTVSPSDFPLIGKIQYKETLRLKEREVVLTFADGPYSPYTSRILDALAAECTKATFFVTGNAVNDAPDLVRRAFNEGHTIGTHSFSGDNLSEMPLDRAKEDIDKGIAAAVEALGKPEALAPFFRAPDLEISKTAERYVLSKKIMIWSGDVDPEDWNEPTEDEFVAKAIAGLEKEGRGIITLHDNQPVTARAIKQLLTELRTRKFKVVHVVAPKATVATGVSQ